MYDTAGASGLTILKNVIHAFNDSEFDLIVSTGTDQQIVDIPAIASNITLKEWVPTNEIAKECSLIIHHGGHGSCMLSLVHGIPSIVIPTFSEREFNARQLSGLGVGYFIPSDNLTPRGLLDLTRKCINDETLRSNSRNWSAEIKRRNYGGAEEAKRLIMNLIM